MTNPKYTYESGTYCHECKRKLDHFALICWKCGSEPKHFAALRYIFVKSEVVFSWYKPWTWNIKEGKYVFDGVGKVDKGV